MRHRSLKPFVERPFLAPVLVCTVGFLLTAIGFWPGIAPNDAMRQYCQATTHSYNTWHPVAMAAWWSILHRVYAGPAPMLLFQLILYWGAWFLMADALRKLPLRYAWSLCLLGFMPFLVNFTGVLLKDTGLTVSWAFASALIFRAYVGGTRLGLVGATLTFLLLAYGSLVRINAAFALFPVLGMAVFVQFRPLSWRRLSLGTIAAAAAIFALAPILNYCVEARENNAFSSVLLYDIAGIAARCGEDVLPPYVRAHPEYSWQALCDVCRHFLHRYVHSELRLSQRIFKHEAA